MAIGYTMIYGIVGLVTFNYGETVMIGTFGAFYCFIFTGNFFIGLIGGFATSAVLGILIHKICYERFLDAPRHVSLICTIGFAMMIKSIAQILFGSEVKPMPQVFRVTAYEIRGLRITNLQLIIIGVVIVFCVILTVFLNKTRTGTMLRAVSQDRKAAALMGINVKATTLIGNCAGCALGGVAGALLGLYYTTVVPTMGEIVGLKAFAATVIGGLTRITSSALGGLSIGILENVGIILIPTGLRDVIAFVFIVIVLIFRPQGLFMKRRSR
jgi:branched-chain amino acid transport system permease protein